MEVFSWETDPESASEDEEPEASINEEERPEEVPTEQPEREDVSVSRIEADVEDPNPMAFKSLISQMENYVPKFCRR